MHGPSPFGPTLSISPTRWRCHFPKSPPRLPTENYITNYHHRQAPLRAELYIVRRTIAPSLYKSQFGSPQRPTWITSNSGWHKKRPNPKTQPSMSGIKSSPALPASFICSGRKLTIPVPHLPGPGSLLPSTFSFSACSSTPSTRSSAPRPSLPCPSPTRPSSSRPSTPGHYSRSTARTVHRCT